MSTADSARRQQLLAAALGVFMRYGFRKTSMDEVARAAGLSRQGLYLHFRAKDELFRATLTFTLDRALVAAQAALDDASLSLDARLTGAFDAWIGQFVGLLSGDAADLGEASGELVGTVTADYDALFLEAVAKLLRSSGLAAAYRPSRLNARDLAATLHAAARGLKYSAKTRAEFVERFSLAARALTAAGRDNR